MSDAIDEKVEEMNKAEEDTYKYELTKKLENIKYYLKRIRSAKEEIKALQENLPIIILQANESIKEARKSIKAIKKPYVYTREELMGQEG